MQSPILAHHLKYAEENKPQMAVDPSGNLAQQKERMKAQFRELIRVPEKTTQPELRIEYVKTDDERFDEIRFSFESEPGLFIPAHLLFPKGVYRKGEVKLPVTICLQGHSTGMHISLARPKYEHDDESIQSGDRDFAIQAVSRGYAAVAMEQRGFGELDGTVSKGSPRCQQASMQALMMGRTMQGERAYDVSRLIDVLAHFDECDLDRIGLMGNSGGGTTTFYTSCVEPRIQIIMPSCSFCTLYDSIFSLHHCVCNYIPDLYRYFEMGDLALLIAPRPFIAVCGKDDPIFPLAGVKKAYEKVKAIYTAMGVPDNCRLIIGDGGHRFYADQSWPVYQEMLTRISR